MTSIFSSNTFKYYRYRLFNRKAPLILLIILNILSYPLLFGTALLAAMHNDIFGNMVIAMLLICIISLIIIFTTGFYIAISSFDYLHGRSVVDMNMSLPLTSGQRFSADYLAGLTMYTVPYIFSSALGAILYSIATAIYTSTAENGALAEELAIGNVVQYMTAGLIAMIMLYSMVVLVNSFCGSVVESTIYSVVFNGTLTAATALIAWLVYESVFGMSYESSVIGIVGASSPLGELFATAAFPLLFVGFSPIETNVILSVPTILWNIVFIAACTVGAYFAVKFRKAEQVGKPFVYRVAYHAMMAVSIFCIVCPFTRAIYERISATRTDYYSSYTDEEPLTLFITMLVLTFIVFIVFDIITGRGFKKVLRGLLRYIVTVAGCTAVCALLISADGFGMSYYVPETDSVSSVTVSFDSANYPVADHNGSRDIIFTEKDSIDVVTQLHQEMIASYGSENNYSRAIDAAIENVTRITLTYTMKTGTSVQRYYDVDKALINRVTALPVSEETKLAHFEKLRAQVLQGRAYLTNGFFVSDITFSRNAEVKVSVEAFLEVIKKDILAEADEQFYGDFLPAGYVNLPSSVSSSALYAVQNKYDNYCFIKPTYVNVIKLFEENGAEGIFNSDFEDTDDMTGRVFIYKTSADKYVNYLGRGDNYYVKINYDERLKELLRKCYVSYNYCDYYNVPGIYVVRIISNYGFKSFLVPPELYDEAESIISSADKKTIAIYDDGVQSKVLEAAGLEYTTGGDGMLFLNIEMLTEYNNHARSIFAEKGYEVVDYNSNNYAVHSFGEDKSYIYVVDENDEIVEINIDIDEYVAAEDREVA